MIIFDIIELKEIFLHFSYSLQIISILTLICLTVLFIISCKLNNHPLKKRYRSLRLLYAISNMIGVSTVILSFVGFLTIIAGIRYYSPNTPAAVVITETTLKIEACGIYLIFFSSLSLLISSYLWIKIWKIEGSIEQEAPGTIRNRSGPRI
jgi:hypothetical protein